MIMIIILIILLILLIVLFVVFVFVFVYGGHGQPAHQAPPGGLPSLLKRANNNKQTHVTYISTLHNNNKHTYNTNITTHTQIHICF